MSTHPDLLPLLRAELAASDAAALADHLDSCADCREVLADLAVGHALLARSARTLDEGGPAASTPGPTEPLPPLRARPRGLRRVRPVTALVGAAALVAAAVGVVATLPDSRTASPPDRTAVTATLDPVEGHAHGTVRMARPDATSTRMTITATALPQARGGQFYEAWLLDPDTLKMLPLGQLGPGRQASFEVADRLLSRYDAIDVSLENDDGNPQHSVTSVLRASYDASPAAPS